MKGIYWLALLGITSLQGLSINPSLAQSNIIPDNSLGAESSQVIENFQGLPVEVILGGAERGINLFHSFREFNVSEGRGAYFSSPNAEIQNILTRVTGNNRSDILGTLGTFGSSQPNLFLINPNGIVFGSNASLDVGGSFVATTADGIAFGERGLFSATEPQRSNLLSVNPSAFFFNAVNSQGQIVNRSRATTTVLGTPVNAIILNGLSVVTGESLLLVGNDVRLEGGILQAPSGRIEIGGLAETGTVGLNVDENNLQLSYPVNVARANVVLDNGAAINVNGDPAGNIRLEGNNVSLSGASSINSTTINQDSGDIFIRADNLELAGNSSVGSNTFGTGKSGDITIDTGIFTTQENSSIFTSSLLASGKTGNITLQAKDSVNINNSVNRLNSAGLSTFVIGLGDGSTTGTGGNISIETKELILQNANILVSTFLGQGNAGKLKIIATNSVNLNNSLMTTSSLGAGTGGSIVIETKKFNIENGSRIFTSVFDPTNVDFSTVLDPRVFSSDLITVFTTLISTINSENVGKANSGDVTILASDSVNVTGESVNGTRSSLSTETFGAGEAGDLTIDTGRLVVNDGGFVSVSTAPNSQGKGGNLTVIARDSVKLSGTTTNEQFSSGLSAGTEGTGNGGEIQVTTDKLIVRDGAAILVITNNQGKGGSLTITASDFLEIRGSSKNNLFFSRLVTDTFGAGEAGNLNIDTGRLVVKDGGFVSVGTRPNSQGKGGNLTVIAQDSVEISGTSTNEQSSSGLFAATAGTGDGGEIQVTTDKLIVRDRAVISATTNNQGKGGSITITAPNSVEISGSSVNILFVNSLVTDTFGTGDAGNLTIDTGRLVVRDGAFVSTGTRQNSRGNGGNLTVETSQLIVRDGGQISTSTFGKGKTGNLDVRASEFIELIGSTERGFNASGLYVQVGQTGEGDAGDLNIETNRLTVVDGAQVNATTFGKGNGGNLTVTVPKIELLGTTTDGNFPSALQVRVEPRAQGNAGNLTIETDKLSVRDGARVAADTTSSGNAGKLLVRAQNLVEVSGISVIGNPSGLFAGAIQDSGDGGDLRIQTDQLTIQDGATVSVSNFQGTNLAFTGSGSPGNLEINADSIVLDNKGSITAATSVGSKKEQGNIFIRLRDVLQVNNSTISTTSEQSSGGVINITAQNIRLFGDSDIRTNVFTGDGGGGNINLTANSIIAFDDSDILAFARDGKGGDIKLNTPAFFGENYQPAPKGTDPATLDGNNRVDINASGAVSGVITLPDTTFIQNSLTELQQNPIDTNALILTSCIARSNKVEGTFVITGSGGLPNRPGDPYVSPYPTGTVQGVTPHTSSWKKGDPIMEPTGVYPLEDGQLVMSREC